MLGLLGDAFTDQLYKASYTLDCDFWGVHLSSGYSPPMQGKIGQPGLSARLLNIYLAWKDARKSGVVFKRCLHLTGGQSPHSA